MTKLALPEPPNKLVAYLPVLVNSTLELLPNDKTVPLAA